MCRDVTDDFVTHERQGELVIIGAAAQNDGLVAGCAQLLGNCSAIGPTINEKMASMSDLMPGMYGPKSLLPKGTQISLHDLAAAILEGLLEPANLFVAEGVIGADRGDAFIAWCRYAHCPSAWVGCDETHVENTVKGNLSD